MRKREYEYDWEEGEEECMSMRRKTEMRGGMNMRRKMMREYKKEKEDEREYKEEKKDDKGV